MNDLQKEVYDLIKAVASIAPELIEIISCLPDINPIDFNECQWASTIKDPNAHVMISQYEITIITNNHPSNRYKSFITHDIGWQIILGSKTNDYGSEIYETYPQPLDVKWNYSNIFMTELIATCKSKNIQELLNFL